MIKRAIYPGTFDPLTNGHIDIIARACRLFDEILVAILVNPAKQPMFTVAERIEMLNEALTQASAQVKIDTFSGLLVDYARERQAQAIIRGVRSVKDYDYELPMILMNRHLNPEVETIIMVAAEEHSFISSTLIKEVFSLGGSIDQLVPEVVLKRMKDKKDAGC